MQHSSTTYKDPVLSNYSPILQLLTVTYLPFGVPCEVTSKQSSRLTLTRPGVEVASKLKDHHVKIKSTTPTWLTCHRKTGASVIILQRFKVPILPELRAMWGSRSLSPTNRSFSFPYKIDVDTLWQCSMRFWLLIIAKEETDGYRLSACERTVCKKPASSPISLHL